MYKLEFVTTNNTIEHEALLLGLKATKDLGIQHISIYGDSEYGCSVGEEQLSSETRFDEILP